MIPSDRRAVKMMTSPQRALNSQRVARCAQPRAAASPVAVCLDSDRIQVCWRANVARRCSDGILSWPWTADQQGDLVACGSPIDDSFRVQTTHFSVGGQAAGAPRRRCGFRFTVDKSQQALDRFVLCSLWSDMIETLLIMIALVGAAAYSAASTGLRIMWARHCDFRRGQASPEASHSLAAWLRSVSGCRVTALAAALARPAPAAARRIGMPCARYASPPPWAVAGRRPCRTRKP